MVLKKNLIGLIVLAFSLVIFFSASNVYALQSNDSSESLSVQKQAEQAKEDAKQLAEQKKEEAQRLAEQKREEAKQLAEQKREEAKNQAEAALEQKKTEIKVKTDEQRQKACESVSERLNNNLENGSTKANKLKSVFDTHLANIQDFYTKKGLNSTNYDSVLANAKTAGSNAQASIDALDSFKFRIDCSNVGAATSNVAAFKEALNRTKNDLNAYRAAIKALLSDVKQTAEASEKAGQQ